MKIALLGLFGSGNTGNDGSLEAMVNFLRKSTSDAELMCICPNPEGIADRHKVDAAHHGGVDLQSPWMARVNRILADAPRNILSIGHLFATMRGVNVLVIPGTGILDDFQESAFGWPFVVFRWCLAARLSGVRIAFVSIGAGPIKHPLSRWFLKSAVRMARFRSYRDDYSRHYLGDIGVDVSRDPCYPDLAFGLPQPLSSPSNARAPYTIGVGVMDYHGWTKGDAEGERIYQTYLSKLASYICWLIEKGHNVRLLTGDVHDYGAVNDVLEKVVMSGSELALDRIAIGRSGSLHELMDEIAQTDMVVVSRYHNVVCALKLNRPTISLSYNLKNDYLLDQFEQRHYCQHIETFDVEKLKEHTRSVLEHIDAIGTQLSSSNRLVQEQLAEQERVLLRRVVRTDSPDPGG